MLNKHALITKRYIRANQKDFIDEELNQVIKVRYDKYLKLKTEESLLAYVIQCNY